MKKKLFSGYVLVSADFSHGEVQQVVRSVPGVIGFLGSGTGASNGSNTFEEAKQTRTFWKI